MPRLLIVSPHFPPVNAPDMQRVRMSLPHFVEAGWEVVVLAVDDREPQAPLEPALLETIPSEVRVVRARCFSRTWTRRLGVNNLGWRAWPFLFAAGRRLLARERFDVVYFSTTQFIVLPLGRLWRRLSGAPYVIDLQDPWVSDFYEGAGAPRPPGGWKYRVARAHARLLEGWTLRRVAHVFSVSERYLEELRGRHAWFGAIPSTVLTFGAPERDFALARRRAAESSPLLPAGASLKVAYAGRLGADMEPALEILLAALAQTNAGRPIELFLFGTSYAASGRAQPATEHLATRHGVQARVHEFPARIGYIDSLRLLLEADLTLLPGSSDRAYSPSKIYPTLLAGKPTLAIVPAPSVLREKLLELGGAALVEFPVGGDCAPAVARTRALLARLAEGSRADFGAPLRKDLLSEKYSSAAIAAAQLRVFEHVRNPHATQGAS